MLTLLAAIGVLGLGADPSHGGVPLATSAHRQTVQVAAASEAKSRGKSAGQPARAAQKRDTTSVRKALLGHWREGSGDTEYFIGETKVVQRQTNGNRDEFECKVGTTNETNRTIQTFWTTAAGV